MSPPRVLLASNYAAVVGGGEISLLTLIKGLRAAGWDPLLSSPAEGEMAERARALGAEVHITAQPPLRRVASTIGALRAARRQIRRLNPALIHANGSRPMFYMGLAARRQLCPVIWHLRILDRDPRLDPLLVRLATASIAISGAVRERLRAWPTAYESCRVIPNGLDLADFAPALERNDVRRTVGLSEDDFVVTTVGRLVDFKRHDRLLEAVASLSRSIAGLRCLVVGDGPEETTLRARAAQADLAGKVLFLGRRNDVPDLLAASDVFVLTSAVEGFGRVLIEAMAMGLPVVTFDAGGPAEILAGGNCGLLVEPESLAGLADAVFRLHADPALRRQLGGAARRRVEQQYSMEEHTRLVMELYREVLAC